MGTEQADGQPDVNAASEAATDTTETTGQDQPAEVAEQTGEQDSQDSAAETPEQAAAEALVDIAGEKFSLKDVNSWREAHGKITQELQTVARMRKDLEPALVVTRALRSNPDLAKTVVGLIENGSRDKSVIQRVAAALAGQAAQQQVGGQPSADPMAQEILALKAEIASFKDAQAKQEADATLNREFAELRDSEPALKQLPELEWKGIQDKLAGYLQNMLADGFNVPAKVAYAFLTKSGAIAAALASGQKAGAQSAAKKAQTPAPKVKAGSAGASAKPKGPMSAQEEEEYLSRFAEKWSSLRG